jgi:hypothetical protein
MKIRIVYISVLLLSVFFMSGCSDRVLNVTQRPMPTLDKNRATTITLFTLKNYTDTPRAGMRAANIIEGVLYAKGYIVHYVKKSDEFKKSELQKYQSDYYMTGAVSEWRYKTGIDGEPAVSFRLALYDSKTNRLVWSGVGSDNDWGNASIGTTAQALIEDMLK